MKKPAVTVLVTVRNAKQTIEKCIKSLLGQSYSNYNIYVTDAHSEDNTWSILQKFKKKIKLERIRANRPAAYNYMIKKVKTPYIAFTDADCVVDKDWLKVL